MTQNKSGPPAALHEADYEAIEAAVMETARGRRFLSEFARRSRSADTETALEAFRKLQLVRQDQQPAEELSRLRRDIMETATAIAQTRRDLAAMQAARGPETGIGGGELDSIVATAEEAISDILSAAEQVQEIAWTLREQGVAAEPCDALDAHATDIYAACSFQDLIGQRIGKAIAAFNAIEKRLNDLVDIWSLDDSEIKSLDAAAGAALEDESEAVRPSSRQRIDGQPTTGPEPVAAEPEPDAGVLPEAKDVAWRKPAEEPQTAADESLQLFDRLAADLEAAMCLDSPASPAATERSDEPQAGAEAETGKPSSPERPGAQRNDENSDLARLSQAHRTALFS